MPAAREQASHPTNPRRSGRVLTRAAEHQRSGVVAAALAAGGGTARAALTARAGRDSPRPSSPATRRRASAEHGFGLAPGMGRKLKVRVLKMSGGRGLRCATLAERVLLGRSRTRSGGTLSRQRFSRGSCFPVWLPWRAATYEYRRSRLDSPPVAVDHHPELSNGAVLSGCSTASHSDSHRFLPGVVIAVLVLAGIMFRSSFVPGRRY